MALLAAFRKQRNPVEDESTLRTATPQGGVHVYYRLLPHHPMLKSSVGSSSTTALAWQVDVKAAKSAIVAPGTVTRDGVYQRLGDVRMPAPAPDWLIAELARTGHVLDREQSAASSRAVRRAIPDRGAPPGSARLRPLLEEIVRCAGVRTGFAFTEKLNRAAFTAGGLVASGQLAEADAVDLLQAAARQARPNQTQITAIINSGLQAGAHRPFQD
jgi:hypothetical protein